MALYTYITEDCEEDLSTHDFANVVEKFANRIEKDQAIGSVDRYPRPFLKKNVGRHGRLIIEERREGEDTVYCFLRALIRGDSEYDSFMTLCDEGNAQAYLDKYAPTDSEIKFWLEERQAKTPVEPLPTLSSAEYGYLNGISVTSKGTDESVVESREWVKRISHEEVPRELRVRYGDILQDLVSQSEPDPKETIAVSKENDRYRILYRYFPKFHKWFLVAPLNVDDIEEDERKLRDNYARIFNIEENSANELMLQEGLRSYPTLITIDEKLWLNTQESEEANLALSPEEVDVLNSVLSADSSTTEAYPLFINGRPGSGKSTVLLYVFAEHLHFHLQQIESETDSPSSTALQYPPLYLTYSDSLLRDAQRIVHDILRCDSEKAQSEYNISGDKIQKVFDSSFGHFRSFLHNLLPKAFQEKFSEDKYVDFASFRQRLSKSLLQHPSPEVRSISPELAWHVIRTYIKGMRQEAKEYIDVDYYESELPRSQQSVTRENFKYIFEHVWDTHYRDMCEQDGYWDDQDLARCLLDLDQEKRVNLSKHFAIFCDESQDFTKLELELIFRLSLFARRSVGHFQLHKIPFAFAGDPFQTLNPTGFDWGATQASFHDNIVRQLDPAGKTNLSFNFQNLAFNYRSTRPIVQFCNLVQLIRGRAFNQRSLKPQKTWQVGPAADPVYYDVDSPISRQALQNEAALVIIVPCQEGEETEYVKNDPFLREIAWDPKSKTIIRDVLSPMRAKGLQFRRVVLYKFGEYATSKYGKEIRILMKPSDTGATKEETLPIEYFVNQLYVAASRPRQQLIIVDTNQGIERFWHFATTDNQQALIDSYESREEWTAKDITRILRGDQQNWEQSRDDPRQLGQDFFKRGKDGSDPYLMDRAIQNLEAVGDEAKAAEALALKYQYETKYTAAGDVYANKLENPEKAVACYWKNEAYDKIVTLGNIRTELARSLRHRAADFMQHGTNARNSLKFIEHVHNKITSDDEAEHEIITDSKWQDILKRAIKSLGEDRENHEIEDRDWKKCWQHIHKFGQIGLEVAESLDLAYVAYKAERLDAARQILDRINQVPEDGQDWLTQVYGRTTDYPESLRWLHKLGLHAEIIRAYQGNTDHPLAEQDENWILHALLSEKDYESAYAFVVNHPRLQAITTLLSEVARTNNHSLSKRVAGALLTTLVDQAYFNDAIRFAGSLIVPARHAGGKRRTFKIRWNAVNRHALLIRKLARSVELARITDRGQRNKVSSYLNSHLLPSNEKLRTGVMAHEAGAAIERAGKFIDSLAFYESVRNGTWGSDEALKEWARLRWLKNKYRQADYHEKQQQERQHQRAVKEAKDHENIWSVTSEQVEEAPRFPPLASIELETGRAESVKSNAIHDQTRLSGAIDEPVEESQVDAETPSDSAEQSMAARPLSDDDARRSEGAPVSGLSDEPTTADTDETSSTSSQAASTNPPSPAITHGDPGLATTPTESSPEKPLPATHEVPISVLIKIDVGNQSFECTPHLSRRALEIRDPEASDFLVVRASDAEVVDPMQSLSIEKHIANENHTRWYIAKWEITVEVQAEDAYTTIHVLYGRTGQSILNLNI